MRLLVVSMLVFGFPFIMTDVVDSFTTCSQFFFKDQPPVIPGILENSVSMNQNRYKIICQKYDNNYRFATLYDTTNKIPIFSAYKYTGHAGKRPKHPKWRTETQLKDSEQAVDGDYLKNNMNVNRGHLFPCCHAADQETVESTFTLTNAVPQYITFNSGSWRIMEETVGKIMNSDCRDENIPGNILAYVLTGAVPNTETSLQHLLNNRVNIPSHMWTVFCCYNSNSGKWLSQAHWAENIDKSKEEDKKISANTLEKLQDFLKSSLFKGDCMDLLEADVSPPPEADASPPPEADVSPPPEADASPPPEADASPPPEAVASPPPEADASPPPEADASPPPEADVSPPPEADASPPPEADASPPPEAVASPPPEADASPPPEADVSPPPEADACEDEPDIEEQSQWSIIKNLPAAFWAWLQYVSIELF